MNFTQLRYVREAVRRGFNLTEVAQSFSTTQPGVSKSIKDLEDELGVEIFVRRGKRLVGLTSPGQPIVEAIERILVDTQNLHKISVQLAASDTGSLSIATTHTQARYWLPPIIKAFRQRYPKVHFALRQGSPSQFIELINNGQADMAVATEGLDHLAELAVFPCYSWHHGVIVPKGHALEAGPLTLEAIANHPIVTYAESITGRAQIDRAFLAAGLAPDIVMTAIDSDVIKAYVELGLGIGIATSIAFDPDKDTGLSLLRADHLFAANTTKLGFRRGTFLRGYALEFIRMLAPRVSDAELAQALAGSGGGP